MMGPKAIKATASPLAPRPAFFRLIKSGLLLCVAASVTSEWETGNCCLGCPHADSERNRGALGYSEMSSGHLNTEKPQNPLLGRRFTWSGRRDSNPRPSPWQGMSTCFADLRKRPETSSDLHFLLVTGSRRFALFCDASRHARGLRTSGCVTSATTYVAAGDGRPTGPVSALSESVSPTPRDRRLHPGNWPQGDPAGPAGRRRHLP